VALRSPRFTACRPVINKLVGQKSCKCSPAAANGICRTVLLEEEVLLRHPHRTDLARDFFAVVFDVGPRVRQLGYLAPGPIMKFAVLLWQNHRVGIEITTAGPFQ